MFRKIHSNRDPRDTLYRELRKEFSVYAEKGNNFGKQFAAKYPRLLFGLMTALLLASAVLAVWLHPKMVPPEKVKVKPRSEVLNSSFDQILAAGAALKTTIHLRRQVDSITAKRVLTKADSLTLVQDLDSLQHIRLTLPH
ncbi:hypothetical protein SAMN05216464_11012 [Mucilaginibacter pineti]|uniref:Uncharacterized protein n=1 Tax=Mucilaginibacter pineti TaxID=1391627 RepID=A0A1G7G7U1_9SPHI|nr:hypothetical protein [Mucilaginibacter pineti]SDE84218.1 hypothetical protein SAMN05216464_11012 [Mucilaginibacter pineti]